MRVLVLSSLLALPACGNLPGPTPPAQGIYGYVRVDNQVGMTALPSLLVAALPSTQVGSIDQTTPTTPTDADGNFSLQLDAGRWRVCLVDGTKTAQCDCNVNVGDGSQIERLYLRQSTSGASVTGWTGQWRGGGVASSCNTVK